MTAPTVAIFAAAALGLNPMKLALPAQPYAESLIAIGVQARISIVGVAQCPGRAAALIGTFTLRQALDALLRHAPCRYAVVTDTVRLYPRRTAAAPVLGARATAPLAIADTPRSTVDEVVVTAQKRPEFASRAAGDVSVFGAARLSQISAIDALSIAGQLSALVLTNLGPGRDKLLLRGISDGAFTGRARSTLATYLDDSPITYNAPDPDLVLSDVERVEILRGPQGELYGGGSLGGVYRVVTRAPQLDVWGGALQLRGAQTQRGAASGGGQATVNLPLIAGAAAGRITVYDQRDGGYLQDQNLRRSNVDETRRTGGRIALRASPASGWTMTVSAAYQHLTTADTQYTTLAGNGLRRTNLVGEGNKADFAQAGLTTEGRLGPLQLHAATSFVRHDIASRYDASAALSAFDAPAAEFGAYDEAIRSTILSQDIFVSTSADRPLSALAGVSIVRQTQDTPAILSARAPGSKVPQVLYTVSRTDHLGEEAVYGDLRWRRGGWTLTSGGRVFHTDVEVDAQTVTPRQRLMARTLKGAIDGDGFSPKLSLQYAFNPGLSLYALASRGDRPGGFNSGALRAPTTAERTFAPDHLSNYEVGLKMQHRSDAELDLTLFHDRWRRIQTDQFYATGLPFTGNVGDGVVTGAEASAVLRPVRGLRLEANSLFTTSEIDDPDPGFATRLRKGLPGAPAEAFNLYALWTAALGRDLELMLSGRAAYTGRTQLTYDVTAANTTSSPVLDAELSAGLRWRRYTLALNLKNPADDRGNTFAYGNPFSFGQVRQTTPQRPRSLELVLSGEF